MIHPVRRTALTVVDLAQLQLRLNRKYHHAEVSRLCRAVHADEGRAGVEVVHVDGSRVNTVDSVICPVLGVPVESAALKGMDSLLSIVQMPGGVPVGTLAIGQAGAKNAALLAVQILALSDPQLASKIRKWRATQTANVSETPE